MGDWETGIPSLFYSYGGAGNSGMDAETGTGFKKTIASSFRLSNMINLECSGRDYLQQAAVFDAKAEKPRHGDFYQSRALPHRVTAAEK